MVAPELPDFVQERLKEWEALKEKKAATLEAFEITVTLPDGREVKAQSTSTPEDVCNEHISKALCQKALVAEVNGELRDMKRPLAADCSLKLFTFNDPEGKKVFWHSSAHILGEAMELKYQGNLCIGPPLADGGFYYDIALKEGEVISDKDFASLKQLVQGVVKEKQTFDRLELSKEEALHLFRYNKYKTEIIQSKVPDGENCTAYRCGPLIDLCRGPHVPHTGRVKFFEVHKNSSAYWLGKAENDSLQRVYGIAFPEKKEMAEWKKRVEEAEKRNHRRIGQAQELFFMDPVTPGCVFMLPHGTRVYNRLQDFIRAEYRKRGFDEVVSPNIFNVNLWKTSGHWDHYKDNMFSFQCEGVDFALKPMNCPGHCIMFRHRARSYRELPVRYADFGVLHRNELSGALTGLTRVRRFQQDDAHIFCMPDQVEAEMTAAMQFMEFVYGTFGFKFDLELSTKPEKAIGDDAVWAQAEAQLERVLVASGHPWKLNPGDGAFYGPKIDIHITDALGRSHQCATIQLDFNLPERFELEFQAADAGMCRPVMIHRAIYGSLERFMAILIEHTAGKWPFWLSPRQIMVVPIHESLNDYCTALSKRLEDSGFYAEADVSAGKSRDKKIAFHAPVYTYVLVVGASEASDDSVNVRQGNTVIGKVSTNKLIEILQDSSKNFTEPVFKDEDILEKPRVRQPAANMQNANKQQKQQKQKANQGKKKGKAAKDAAPKKDDATKEAPKCDAAQEAPKQEA